MPILFGAAGVDSQNQRLVLNFANTIVSAVGALIGTALTDKVGRRTMWFWGTLASAVTLAVVTGMNTDHLLSSIITYSYISRLYGKMGFK